MSRSVFCLAIILSLILNGNVSAQDWYNGPEGAVYDTAHHRYLIANWNNRTIVQIDQNGVESYFTTTSTRIGGLRIVGNLLYGAGEREMVAYDLATAAEVVNVPVAGSNLLNSVVVDTSGYLYVSDGQPARIYRMDLSDHTYTVLIDNDPDLPFPVGLFFEPETNRLLVTTRPNDQGAIHAVSLPDGAISEVLVTTFPSFGYITRDNAGRYFVCCFSMGFILRYTPDFTGVVDLMLTGYTAPSQIFYNTLVDTLVIPDYLGSDVFFVSFRDTDADDIPEFQDNCPEAYNPNQADLDGDGAGDACDQCTDSDADGFGDPGFAANTCIVDNCPDLASADQTDTDGDGVGDACDNCIDVHNPDQSDGDQDQIGDACESCCRGFVGDANFSGDPDPTIGDITVLIDAKFVSGTCDGLIECLTEADINQSGSSAPTCEDITIGDITALIDYLFVADPGELTLPDCL
jgi:sugar lactone lactonase YvrE